MKLVPKKSALISVLSVLAGAVEVELALLPAPCGHIGRRKKHDKDPQYQKHQRPLIPDQKHLEDEVRADLPAGPPDCSQNATLVVAALVVARTEKQKLLLPKQKQKQKQKPAAGSRSRLGEEDSCEV